MKIYAIKGHGERGKSTTLKILIIKILDKYPTAKIIYSNRNNTYASILSEVHNEKILRRRTNCNCQVENVEVVIDIQGKIVAIYTAGDNEWQVNNAIKLFDKYNCGVGYCACRSKGITNKILANKYGQNVEVIDKAELRNANGYKNYNDWIDLLNEWQAEELLNKI